MTVADIYAMTDKAIACEIGGRIDRLRLERNISQQALAEAVGISVGTYRRLLEEGGKFETMIAILRALHCLHLIENLIPAESFSPLELAKLKGKRRQRASKQDSNAAGSPDGPEELNW